MTGPTLPASPRPATAKTYRRFTAKSRERREREVEQLRARAEQAEAELARTQAALDLVGKAHALLETLSESTGLVKRPPR